MSFKKCNTSVGVFGLQLVLTIHLSIGLHAQPELRFERISLEQGLSQSIVESIVQDQTGFLWFCTEDGLNMYDGYCFTVIKNDPDDPNSLSLNQLTTIYEDHAGNLWIGTFNGGLNKLDPRRRQFTRYRHDPNDSNSLSHNVITAICQDRKGHLWIGTQNGLNRLTLPSDKKAGGEAAFVHFRHAPNEPNSLSDNLIRAILEDDAGQLWIGTADGLNLLTEDAFERENTHAKFVVYRNQPLNSRSLSDNRIRAIYQDKAGTLWIGTESGLNRMVERTGTNHTVATRTFVRYVHDPDDPGSLSHDEVYALLEDHTGNFWIGTNGGGLNKLDRETQTFASFRNDPLDPHSLSYDEIRSLCKDRSGNLWIGTYGGGISKIDRGRKAFKHYRPIPGNPNSLNQEIVWGIYEDRDGILWIGTHGGGLNRFDRKRNRFTHYTHDPDNPNSLSSNIVRLIREDRAGHLWIGTHGGGINKFDKQTGRATRYEHIPYDPISLSHNDIRALLVSKSGSLWIGTQGGGLNKMELATEGRFIRYRNDPQRGNSLSNDFVQAIYEDSSGVLWIGTYGGGLNRFEPEQNQFTHYRADPSDPSSLNSDFIMSLFEDHAGLFWIATWGGGLNKFDRTSGTFSNYTEEDGLPSNAIYGILEDENGVLWMSTNNGLSKFDPTSATFRNYTQEDGLQSKEFDGGSYYQSPTGEMFFGGINGFNAFFPADIQDNEHIPPIVLIAFLKFNQEVMLENPIAYTRGITLSHRDYVFSFAFAALDYTAPMKNKYAYKMEGLDKDWIYTNANQRFATYTTLAPGKYTFRVKGSNNDAIWNEEGTAIDITITPPFWRTWWFQGLVALALLGLVAAGYRRRLQTVQLRAELKAAHDAQMSIMPNGDPVVKGFDISGICLPAQEVGGDFFDFFWMDRENTQFGIVIGDVSGKAMRSAMTAVMTSGMVEAKVGLGHAIGDILTQLNRPIFNKIERKCFVALCMASLNISTRTLTFANAGLIEPLLKRNGTVVPLQTTGPKHALGMVEKNIYKEKTLSLNTGDVLVFVTDGITEEQTRTRQLYGEEALQKLIAAMDSTQLSARQIKDRIINDVQVFSGASHQEDDMTVVIVKVK